MRPRVQDTECSVAKAKSEPKSQKSRNPVIRYFQDTQAELRKVSWPTRQEALRLTLIVLAFTFVSMLFLGMLDILFQRLASLLL
jgi:preprotein translocase subunit SecE